MTPKERYAKLTKYLREENPVLVEAIDEYKKLDKIAKKLGFLDKNKTYTEEISWWPLISILGTFSAGKSSFINSYLQKKVQSTGNQAVDDKFTVICYSSDPNITTLPGVALDSDPRFPFYNISREIEKLDEKHNSINKYLQLKAVDSENIKGKIIIDSPGFDADNQRAEILKITEHIISLSDLVLVFFDARHPEPGAMRDTLNHLVEIAENNKDSDKILYILNQIDTCVQEDNLEDVISSWQRALSQKGIVSGKFYTIYNENIVKIDNERLKNKKDEDLREIMEKIDKVKIDRAYRIIRNLKNKSNLILEKMPKLKEKLVQYQNMLLITDILLILSLGIFAFFLLKYYNYDISNLFNLPLDKLENNPFSIDWKPYGIIVAFVGIFFYLHFKARGVFSKSIAKKIEDIGLKLAFLKHTKWYKPYLCMPSSVEDKGIVNSLNNIKENSKKFIQKLNDQFISLKQENRGDKKEA